MTLSKWKINREQACYMVCKKFYDNVNQLKNNGLSLGQIDIKTTFENSIHWIMDHHMTNSEYITKRQYNKFYLQCKKYLPIYERDN
jgi:hypothetical protein